MEKTLKIKKVIKLGTHYYNGQAETSVRALLTDNKYYWLVGGGGDYRRSRLTEKDIDNIRLDSEQDNYLDMYIPVDFYK
jgi:hypothetical protein